LEDTGNPTMDGAVWCDGLEVYRIEGDHLALLVEPGVDVLAEKLAEAMGIKRDEQMAQGVLDSTQIASLGNGSLELVIYESDAIGEPD
jgi:hypothetical protein